MPSQHMKSPRMNGCRKRGFTLLEVLIALLIFSFGMLGLAALQSFSVKANQSANYRSQATALTNTMLDNIRANRDYIQSYYSSDYAAGDDCTTSDPPDGATQAEFDVNNWRYQVSCELPAGEAAIAPISANEVAVCIRWSDSRLQSGATTGSNCVDDAATFGAGESGGGTGAGTDGESSVFIVTARL
ncbi:MAG: type IV pilus modification protein PilV [Rhodanobacteraceae bacterium]